MTLGKFLIKCILSILGITFFLLLLDQTKEQNNNRAVTFAERDLEADLKIKNGHFLEVEDNQVVWQMEAAQARLFEDENYASLEGVKASRVLDNGRKVHIESKSGNYRMDTKDLYLNGQIKIETDNQVRLTTESLQWSNQEQKIYTNDWVSIEHEGMRLVGKGMETDDKLSNIQIKDQVSTHFN